MIFVLWKPISRIVTLLISSPLWAGPYRMGSTPLGDLLSVWKDQVLCGLDHPSPVWTGPYRIDIASLWETYCQYGKCISTPSRVQARFMARRHSGLYCVTECRGHEEDSFRIFWPRRYAQQDARPTGRSRTWLSEVNVSLNRIATSSGLGFGARHPDKEVEDVRKFSPNQPPDQKGSQSTLEVEDVRTFSPSQPRVGMTEIATALEKALRGSLAKQVIYQMKVWIGSRRMIA